MTSHADLPLIRRFEIITDVLSWSPRSIRMAEQHCLDSLIGRNHALPVVLSNFNSVFALTDSSDQLIILNYLCRLNAPALALLIATTHYMKEAQSLAVLRTVGRICEHLCQHDIIRRLHDQILAVTAGKPNSEDVTRLADIYIAEGDIDTARALVSSLQSGTYLPLQRRLQAATYLYQCDSRYTGHHYTINLPQDIHRRYRYEFRSRMLAQPVHTIRAYRPELIDDESHHLFRVVLGNHTDGSYGNQFTQYKLWKRIIASTCRYALITEDDAWLLGPIPDPIAGLNAPDDFDIVFVNDRLCPTTYEKEPPNHPDLRPIADALGLIARVFPSINALGSDGYFISREGAEKLVRNVEQEGFWAIGTDWLLVSNCVRPEDVDILPKESNIYKVLHQRLKRRESSQTPLSAYVSTIPIVRHRPFNVSRATRI